MKKYNIFSLMFLLLLNMIDGFITYVGLKLEFYVEKNQFLELLYYNSSHLFIFVKVVVPTIVLLILILLTYQQKLSLITKGFIAVGNFVYITIFMYHIYLIRIVMIT